MTETDVLRSNAAKLHLYRRLDVRGVQPFIGPGLSPHRKPNAGGAGVHCDVCGCLGLRQGALHRGLGFGDPRPIGAAYVKLADPSFHITEDGVRAPDPTDVFFDWDGHPVTDKPAPTLGIQV